MAQTRGRLVVAVLFLPTEMQISYSFAGRAATRPPLHPVHKVSTAWKRGPPLHQAAEFDGFGCCPSFSLGHALTRTSPKYSSLRSSAIEGRRKTMMMRTGSGENNNNCKPPSFALHNILPKMSMQFSCLSTFRFQITKFSSKVGNSITLRLFLFLYLSLGCVGLYFRHCSAVHIGKATVAWRIMRKEHPESLQFIFSAH